ncbi:MAG: packaged DNA stabilization protein [Steroidobacteraceae bacterium]
MEFKNFIDGAYSYRNLQADAQNCVNWYVEVLESGTAKNATIKQLIPTPGLVPVVTGLGTGRGGYVASNGSVFYVAGSVLYKLTITPGPIVPTVSATKVGNVATGVSLCNFIDNGVNVFILSSGSLYSCTLSGASFASVVNPLGIFTSIDYMDTYIVGSLQNTDQIAWTDPLSTNIDPLNFTSAEANSDRVIGVLNLNDDLWTFGAKTIQFFYSYGQDNIIFAPRPNAIIQLGTPSPNAFKKIADTICWIGVSDRGGPAFYIASAYTPVRMSTHAIEQVWAKCSVADLAQSSVEVYQWGGHEFALVNIPNLDSVWVFDITTSRLLQKPTWHERKSSDGAGTEFKSIAQGHFYAGGYHFCGSSSDGNLYVLDENTYTENGNYLPRERTSPYVSQEAKTIFHDRLQADFLAGATADETLDPQVIMTYSDDGFTFSNDWYESAGMTGAYKKVVQFKQLGSSYNRIYRLRCTDPTYWALSRVSIDLRAGAW